MDFIEARKLSNYLSKGYAEHIFRLLMTYKDISATEAASRLNLHVQTVQEFLETMTSYEILSKQEVSESKRPYFRYKLAKRKISLEIDLDKVLIAKDRTDEAEYAIREKKNSGAKFTVARSGKLFSSVSIWKGDGRGGKERKINLTEAQGMRTDLLLKFSVTVKTMLRIGKYSLTIMDLPISHFMWMMLMKHWRGFLNMGEQNTGNLSRRK